MFAGVALVGLVYAYVTREKKWLYVLSAIVAAAVVYVAGRTDGLPAHVNQRSSAISRLPLIGERLSSVPLAYETANRTPPFDELKQRREELRAAARKVRGQKATVGRAMKLVDAADAAMDLGKAQEQSVRDIVGAKRALAEALDKRELGSAEARRAITDGLEKYVGTAEARMAAVSTATAAVDVIDDFRGNLKKVSVDDINDQMLALEDAIGRLTRDTIGADVRIGGDTRLRLDEQADRIEQRQVIEWSTSKFPLRSIDASEWMLDRDPAALSETLSVFFGRAADAAEGTPVSDPRDIPIASGIRHVTLVKRTLWKAEITELPSSLRRASFRYFLLKLPPPSTIKLRATLDLSTAKGPDRFPYAVDFATNLPVSEMRLPANALFASNFSFEAPRREGAEDAFKPRDALTPAYFQSHENLWIELMPEEPAFRNAAVQKGKDLFFTENLLAALAAAVAGLLLAALFS